MNSKRKLLFENFFEDTPSHWKLMPFEEVVFFQEGPGILAKDFVDWRGTPLLRLTNISTSPANIDKCCFLDPELVKEKWSHFKLDLGDLLIGTSATIGSVSIVDETTVGSIPYTGIIRLRPKSEILTAGYLRCFLLSREYQLQAEASATGSVIRHYGPSHLRKMTIAIPPLEEQYVLSENFDSLSLMIKSKEHVIGKIGSIIQSLFRSWFVDFDPVKAKAKGMSPHGMDSEIAALFPDCFEDSELGEIPAGWKLSSLKDIQFTKGKVPKSNSAGIEIALIDMEYLNSGVLSIIEAEASVMVNPGDIIMLMDGENSGFVIQSPIHGALGSTFAHLKVDDIEEYFVFHLLLSKEYWIRRNTTGTGIPHVDKEIVRRIKYATPPTELLDKFNYFAQNSFKILQKSKMEIESLVRTRDALLPRMMSGELKVPTEA